MNCKIITCECGNTYNNDIWEGLCCVCGKRAAPQNLPKEDTYSLLGEGFDIDTAIEDMGNCHRQKVNCKDCKLGKLLFEAKCKDRIDDLCDKDMVYFCARVVKTFT